MSDFVNRVFNKSCETMNEIPDRSIDCCVTSPPYWRLRDYDHGEQIGLERTPAEYVERMVAVFREVWRALRDDGTLWLNIGDSYASAWSCNRGKTHESGVGAPSRDQRTNKLSGDLKEKDLVGIPWKGANKRTVWSVSTGAGYSEAHFATFPPDLIRPCVLAGSRPNGIVLDPFMGSGTTARVAIEHGRCFVGYELNPAYCNLIRDRLGLFGDGVAQ